MWSLMHFGFFFLSLAILFGGAAWIYYSRRIIDWLWPKQMYVLKRLFDFVDVDMEPYAKASHLSEQKEPGVWLYRIGGFLLICFSLLFLYTLFKYTW
jgi:hypothetical protein